MPVGESLASQRLVRVVRVSADRYEHEELDPVTFVPLIGAEGWLDGGS
jgi:protein-L-isoaspartate(D-aspartate) O-methyltransferase